MSSGKGYAELAPFQQRVVDEREQLNDRLGKLNSFIGGEVYMKLPADERTRLARQAQIMKDYADILSDRIAAFQ